MHIVVLAIQWNPSNADTNGAEESVLYKEVSLYQGLKCMQEWYLGRQKVSLLEGCPQFRGVLIGGFHCSAMRSNLTCSGQCFTSVLDNRCSVHVP